MIESKPLILIGNHMKMNPGREPREEAEFPDPTRCLFQALGGQVFRLAPIEGGL